jgi:hypothetical protein
MGDTVRKPGLRQVPLSEIKDDFSRFCMNPKRERSSSRGTASRLGC